MKIPAAIAFLLLTSCSWLQAQIAAPAPSPSAGKSKSLPAISDTPLKIDSAKETDIRRLFELTGGKQMATQVMTDMVSGLKPLMTNALPPGDYREKVVDLFFAKFQSRLDTQQLVDLAVPIYDKYLTHEEVQGLIEFYQTPLGQKTLKTLPAMLTELQQAGRKWGEDLGRRSMQEVLAEHPDLAKALEDAAKAAQSH